MTAPRTISMASSRGAPLDGPAGPLECFIPGSCCTCIVLIGCFPGVIFPGWVTSTSRPRIRLMTAAEIAQELFARFVHQLGAFLQGDPWQDAHEQRTMLRSVGRSSC